MPQRLHLADSWEFKLSPRTARGSRNPLPGRFLAANARQFLQLRKLPKFTGRSFFKTLRLPGKTRIPLAARYWSLPGTYSHAQLQKVGGYIGKFL